MKMTLSRCSTSILAAILLLSAFSAGSADLMPPPIIPHPELWPEGMHAPQNAEVQTLVAQLLAQMTLEEKIGQMIQADIASISPADLRTYKLGSILAGGNAAPGNNVRTSAQAWLELVDAFYRESRNNGGSHRAIPILFGLDAVHGNAKLLGATIFPHNVGLGAAHDPELMLNIGQATAAEVSAVGIDWTFAPTVAVVRDVRWGRSYESYSEGPALVAAYAAQMVTGLQGQRGTAQFMSPGHTLSSVKHFVGDGGTLSGRDQGNTVVTESQLSSVHAAGYPAAIRAGAMIVMASYNSWNGVKLHGSHYLLTDILKGRLAFDGFVVGDWNAQEQLPGCTKYRCSAAILAGIDMLMAPDSWKALFDNTLSQTRAGEIPMARIDDAVTRILRVKVIAGLFERPPPKERADLAQLGSAAHRVLARQAVRESLVLLKNDRATLPLNPRSRILVAGDAADSIGAQSGGWTIDWQGDRNGNADFPGATSIYAGIKAAVEAAGGTVELHQDGQFRQKPDAAIVVFGEQPYAEFQGDRETLEFSPNDKHELILLRKLRAARIPTVALFLSGRPLWTNPEINASDAFVAAWLPGSEGEGVADVLFKSGATAAFDFTGRLAFSWPKSAMPVAFDSAGQVTGALFPTGWGLNYHGRSNSTRLSEDPAIPRRWRAPVGSLFHSGHPTSPWSIFVADGGDEVHLTNTRQESPHATIAVEMTPDGALTAKWAGTASGILKFSGRPIDLRAAANQGVALEMRYRVDHLPEGHVSVGILSGTMLDVTRTFKTAAQGQWRSLTIPLSCLSAAPADLAEVAVPLAIETSSRFVLSISEAKLMPQTSPLPECPGGPTG